MFQNIYLILLAYKPRYHLIQRSKGMHDVHEPGLKLVDEQGLKAITQESDVLLFPTLFDN